MEIHLTNAKKNLHTPHTKENRPSPTLEKIPITHIEMLIDLISGLYPSPYQVYILYECMLTFNMYPAQRICIVNRGLTFCAIQ